MRAVDTNIVVRLITRDDERQAAEADRVVRGGVWLSIVAVSEVAWVLASLYELPRDRVADSIALLLRHEHITLEQAPAIEQAIAVFRRTSGVSFADCLLIEVARVQGFGPLVTSDKRLAKLNGAEIVTA